MFNKEEYTKNLFEKYKKIDSNDKFFKTKFQKSNKYKILDKVIVISLLLCLTTVIAYTAKNRINQKVSPVDTVNVYENIEKNMKYNEKGSYYQILLTYEDYIKAKNDYGDLIALEESDFQNNFVVLIANLRDGVDGLYVSNIENENNKLIITLNRKDSTEIKAEERLISVKIDKKLYSENMDIIIQPLNLNEEKYSDISTFPIDYTKEEAIKDGYIVIYNKKIISENDSAIDDFIEKTNDGTNSHIRIIDFNDSYQDCYVVSDIEFKNNQYELSQIEIGEGAYFNYTRFYTCKYMIKKESTSEYLYTIEDNDGYNNRTYNICSIYK